VDDDDDSGGNDDTVNDTVVCSGTEIFDPVPTGYNRHEPPSRGTLHIIHSGPTLRTNLSQETLHYILLLKT